MSSQDERTRGWAADKILDRGMGKAGEPKDDTSPLRSLPPDQQRQRIREILARAAAVQVPPDCCPTEAAPGDNDDQLE